MKAYNKPTRDYMEDLLFCCLLSERSFYSRDSLSILKESLLILVGQLLLLLLLGHRIHGFRVRVAKK
jgi:hypothetical protein